MISSCRWRNEDNTQKQRLHYYKMGEANYRNNLPRLYTNITNNQSVSNFTSYPIGQVRSSKNNYIQHVQLYNYIQYVLFHIPQTKNQFFTFCGCRNENPNKITKTSKNVKN